MYVYTAASIIPTVTTAPGTLYKTAALTGYETTNADMTGSIVTVTFLGGSTGTATWTTAGALGTGWSLTEDGDTFDSPWTFSNLGSTAIIGFTFDGVPGNTIFDIINDYDDYGTPGSFNGKPFSNVTGPTGLLVNALYINELLVDGIFYGDEYTKLVVSLSGTGLASGQALSYNADTDNATAASGITLAATPEPSSFVLLGTGLAGLCAVMRRRVVAYKP